jgi:hypothetical protein
VNVRDIASNSSAPGAKAARRRPLELVQKLMLRYSHWTIRLDPPPEVNLKPSAEIHGSRIRSAPICTWSQATVAEGAGRLVLRYAAELFSMPNKVPCPMLLVEKKGSNARSSVA